MSPFRKLVVRADRALILFVVAGHGHACAVGLERVRRHALVDVVVGNLYFARELNVVVLWKGVCVSH